MFWKSNGPISCKSKTFSKAVLDNPSFFLDDSGGLVLKEDYTYYYQVQLQMKICRVQYCDFVTWREDEIFHQKVELDSNFIDSAVCNVEPFIKFAILPELVGKWFSKEPIMPLQTSSSTTGTSNMSTDISQADSADTQVDASSNSDLEVSDPLNDQTISYCYCGNGEDYDDMIYCDKKECTIKWFYFSCLRTTKKDVPKGKYFCPDCHLQRSSRKSKNTTKRQ